MPMTNETPDPTAGIIAATQRLIDASRAIDTKKSLEGIKSRRLPPRARKHSVSHKSYR